MKKNFLLSCVLFCFSLPLFSQSADLHGFIQQHKSDKGFIYAFLSKDLFEATAQTRVDDKDWQQLQRLIRDLGSLSILAGEKVENSRALYREAYRLVPQPDFEEILSVRDEAAEVRLWVKDDESTVTDLVLLVCDSEEFALVCFNGKIDLTRIMEIIDHFDAEGSERIAQAVKAASVDFNVSPNPGKGDFTIQYRKDQDVPDRLGVIDQNGRQVSEFGLQGIENQTIRIDRLPAGTYWFQLRTSLGNIGVKQVVVTE